MIDQPNLFDQPPPEPEEKDPGSGPAVKVLSAEALELIEELAEIERQLAPTEAATPWDHDDRTLREQFAEYHLANLHVMDELTAICLEVKRAGETQWSMTAAFYALRRKRILQTKGGGPFLLNDKFTAFYSRLIMHRTKELAGFFEIRKRRRE